MASNVLLPLFVVWLCLTSLVSAQTFSVVSGNTTGVTSVTSISVTLDAITYGFTTLTVTATPAGIVSLSATSNFFFSASTWNFQATGLAVGIATLTFSANVPNYTLPNPKAIFVPVNARLSSESFYPGTTIQGSVSLDYSPNTQVIATIVASSNLVFSQSVFTFNKGDSPYNQVFTATSVEPGTYYVWLALSGPDFVNGETGPAPNVTYFINLRNVLSNPTNSLPNLLVGQVSSPILVYLDVAPDSGLTVTVSPSTSNVIATPSVLSFTPTTLAISYTLTGSAPAYVVITYNLTGPDAAKYTLGALPYTYVNNRTVTVPTIPSLVVGVPTSVLSAYVAYPPPSPLTLSFSSLDLSLVFTPPSLTFSVSNPVGSFVVTATNVNSVLYETVVYSLSGTDASWFSVPSLANVNIATASRTVNSVWNFNTNNVPLDSSVSGYLQLNVPTPTSFTVTLSAANVVFTPSSITFLNASGTLEQSFTLKASALGSTRIYFTITGVDSGLVSAIPSVALTVIQYAAPYFSIGNGDVGVAISGSIVLSQPVLNSLTITLSTSPATIPVVLSASSFTLTPQGYGPGTTSYAFTLVATSVGTVILQATLSGPDSGLFAPMQEVFLTISSVGFYAPSFTLPTTLIVGVPVTGLRYDVSQPPFETVTLTPHAASLQFTPPALVFNPTTDEVCFSLVPVTATNLGDVITWTSSDPTNYPPPGPVTVGPILTKTFTDTSLNAHIALVVGVPSQPYPISVNYPPINSPVTLTPGTTDGLVFSPTSLSFTPNTSVLYLTITATSLTNLNPIVTWTLTGSEAGTFSVPAILTNILVSPRGVYSNPTALPTGLVNIASGPVVLTTTYLPPNGLTITPSALNVVFTPTSASLSATTPFAIFTATYPTWIPQLNDASSVAVQINYVLTGPDAGWYTAPHSTWTVTQRSITISSPSYLTYSAVASTFIISLQEPAEAGLTISFCAPQVVSFSPSAVVFLPGQLTAEVAVDAVLLLDTTPLTQVYVGVEVSGGSVESYIVPAPFYMQLVVPSYGISLSNFPTQLTIGDVPYVFQVSAPFLEFPSATLVFSGWSLSFTPAQVTFTPGNLHFYVAVSSTRLLNADVNPFTDTATFEVLGPAANLQGVSPNTRTVYVYKRTISLSLYTTNTIVGIPTTGSITLSNPPSSGTLTITLAPVPGISIIPPALVFSPNTTIAYFVISTSIHGSYTLSWEVVGFEAAFYALPGTTNFVANLRTINEDVGSVQLRPGRVNAVRFTLSTPTVNGLTITPVLPSPVQTSPATLTIAAGSNSGRFLFSSSSNIFTTASSTVSFLVGGPDVSLYSLPSPIALYLELGTIYVAGISNTVVGTPTYSSEVYINLPTLNGFSLTPTAIGATFTPSVINFSPGASTANLVITPWRVGSITVEWTLSGPDAWLYYLPNSISIYSNSRGILFEELSTYISGTSIAEVGVSTPPAVSLVVTPTAVGLTFSPASFQFTPTITTLQAIYTPTLCGTTTLTFLATGPDAPWYNEVSSGQYQVTIPCRMISVSGSFGTTSGVSANIWVELSAPGSITLTPTAPGCVFTPLSFAFSSQTLSASFWYVCDVAAGASYNPQIPILYAISGTDVGLYLQPTSSDIYISENVLYVPGYLDVYSGNPVTYSVYLYYPPYGSITVTPTASNAIFSPTSITFTSNTYASLTVTPTSPGTVNVVYLLSGPGSPSVVVSNTVTQIDSQYGYLNTAFQYWEYAAGQTADPVVVVLTPPPVHGVTFTPSAPGCTFTPASLVFVPLGLDTVLITAVCSSVGYPLVQFSVSGLDAVHYSIPQPYELVVYASYISVELDNGSPEIWFDQYGTIYLSNPTQNGLTLTPSAPDVVFTPSSFVFPPWTATFPFQYVGTTPGTTVISWSLSGPDASLYTIPDWYSLTLNPLGVTQLIPDFGSGYLYAGTPSETFSVVLDHSPINGLTVLLYGAGLIFTPSSLVFSPGETGESFVVQVTASGSLTIYYALSGPDAIYYQLNSPTTEIETNLIDIQIYTQWEYNPVPGLPSPPLLIYGANTPHADVTLTLSGALATFDPPTITLGPSAPAAVFTFTPSYVGYGDIWVHISGPGAADFQSLVATIGDVYVEQHYFYTPDNLPDLFPGITSSLVSIAVDYPPPTGIVVTPTAAGVIFIPSTLIFTPDTYHVEFSLLASQVTEYNMYPYDYNAPVVVVWEITGTDAAWYEPIGDYELYIVPRDLQINYPNSEYYFDIYVNVPFIMDFSTTYPPPILGATLTITPIGAYLFDPPFVTITSGNPSASINVTALLPGYNYIGFQLGGSDAEFYTELDYLDLYADLWYFETPDYNALFEYGEWSAPLLIRPSYVPANNVTLTLSSAFLNFIPSTLTFGPESPAAQFQLELNGLGYDRASYFEINYWVGGPDAYLFQTPGTDTIYWDIYYPTRALTVSNFPDYLTVGIPSAPVTITIPNYPLAGLTITPVSFSPQLFFDPPSIQLVRTSTSLTASFTVLALQPYISGYVYFSLSGFDAIYYQAPVYYIYDVYARDFSFSLSNLVVGINSQPFVAYLVYPTPNRVTLQLSSHSISFWPSTLTFLPNVSTVAFIANGGTVGDSIPVQIAVGGEDAYLYDPATEPWSNFPDSLSVQIRTFDQTPYYQYVAPGESNYFTYLLDTPPSNSLIITPTAGSITFEPASIQLNANESSATFWFTSWVAGGYEIGTTILSGPDALWYEEIDDFYIETYFLYVEIYDLPYYLDLGQLGTISIYVDPPVNGVYVTPSSAGIVFDPPTLFFPPGVQIGYATFTATIVGKAYVQITLSGPDQLLYQAYYDSYVIYTYPLYFDNEEIGSIVVGSTSDAVIGLSLGGGNGYQLPPVLPVTLTFLTSPPGAVTVFPPNITIAAPAASFHIQVRPNIIGDYLYVWPVISGPGADYYYTPDAFEFSSIPRSFTLTDFTNYVVSPNTAQLTVGVTAGPFGITANSVPSDVTLTLSAPGLQFIPSVLLFTGTFETLYFKVVPLEVINTQVTYSVGGSDAPLFYPPDPSEYIQVTHRFIIPSLPSIIIGRVSDPLTVYVTDKLSSPVVLTPSADCVNFYPPFLLFTPNSTSQTFTYIGNCVNYNLGNNYNPVETGSKFTTSPSYSYVEWIVREVGTTESYALAFPQLQGVNAVNVVPATFSVHFNSLKLGSTSNVVINVTVAPRSDVVLTLIGNNLNFNPPYVTFNPNVTSVTITATPVHSDFKDSDEIPFTVDYIVSGSNWREFIPPAQTFLGIAQGNGDVAGGICGGSGTIRVGLWTLVVFIISVVFLQ